MRHPRQLVREKTVLLIIDIQEGFRKILPDVGDLVRNTSILVETAKILKLPVIVTEQYPQGLGHTLKEIDACLGEHKCFAKTAFSCLDAEGFTQSLKQIKRTQVLVCGIEAHVCINQTVHGLLHKDYQVHLAVDAISSRSPRQKEIGIQKMVESGAVRSSVEMALFEMIMTAGAEEFKAVQRLVK